MTDPRAAAEVLVLAHQAHGAPAPRCGPSPSAPPPAPCAARAPSRQAPPRGPATSERARPRWMEWMGIPLTGLSDLHLDRIARLEELAGEGGYGGWGREAEGPFFVDADGRRFYGNTLHGALGEALRALGGDQ